MNNNLLILGVGQYGTSIMEIAKESGLYSEIAFLDDERRNENVCSCKNAIGKICDAKCFAEKFHFAIPAIGSAETRVRLISELESFGFIVPALISKRAFVSPSARLQTGVVIEPLAIIQANAFVGAGSYVSAGAVINYNSMIGDGCHISNNTVVMAGTCVKSNTVTAPCEVVKPLTADCRQRVPQYDKNEKWVEDYIRENGHEPTFF